MVALTSDPRCLFAATDDRLHQPYRAEAMPETSRLVAELRARGYAATVSGAGPSVLVLDTRSLDAGTRELASEQGFRVQQLEIAGGVRIG